MKLKIKLTIVLILLVNICISAQTTYTISGVVTAQSDKSPLPGVTVRIANTSTGTQTDFDGEYSMKVKNWDVL